MLKVFRGLRCESAAARAVRLDSLGWARYGFGATSDVELRVREIAALRPGAVRGGGI